MIDLIFLNILNIVTWMWQVGDLTVGNQRVENGSCARHDDIKVAKARTVANTISQGTLEIIWCHKDLIQ